MKSAEQIRVEHDILRGWSISEKIILQVEKAINEARKEVIEYIAGKTMVEDNNFHPVITKEEILAIINELK